MQSSLTLHVLLAERESCKEFIKRMLRARILQAQESLLPAAFTCPDGVKNM